MLYSCTRVATVGVKGLNNTSCLAIAFYASCLRISETPNDVVSDMIDRNLWTAAQRVYATNGPSSFVCGVVTYNHYDK